MNIKLTNSNVNLIIFTMHIILNYFKEGKKGYRCDPIWNSRFVAALIVVACHHNFKAFKKFSFDMYNTIYWIVYQLHITTKTKIWCYKCCIDYSRFYCVFMSFFYVTKYVLHIFCLIVCIFIPISFKCCDDHHVCAAVVLFLF